MALDCNDNELYLGDEIAVVRRHGSTMRIDTMVIEEIKGRIVFGFLTNKRPFKKKASTRSEVMFHRVLIRRGGCQPST